MTDIVPELYADIKKEFYAYVDHDYRIQKILSGKDQSATFGDVGTLASKVGRYAYVALSNHLTPEKLPNGKLYYNIAERTIMPIMQEAHKVVNDMAIAVQKREDKKTGIGLKPIRGEFKADRVEDLINKLVTLEEGENVGTVL